MSALRVHLRVDNSRTIYVGDLELIDGKIYFQYAQEYLDTEENLYATSQVSFEFVDHI